MMEPLARLVARIVARLAGGHPAPARLAHRPHQHAASRAAPEPARPPTVRYLVIVSARAAHQLPQVRALFRADPDVHVLLDRRRGERRRSPVIPRIERRRAERRQPPDYWQDPKYHPVVLVPIGAARAAAEARRAPAQRTTEAVMSQSPTTTEGWERLRSWADEGVQILGRALPALLAERDALRRRNDETERLRAENERLHAELADLSRRHQATLAAQAEIVRGLGAFMASLTQVVEPMRDLAERIQRRSADGR